MPNYNANYNTIPYQQQAPQMMQQPQPMPQQMQNVAQAMPQAQLIPLTQIVGAWVPNVDIARRMYVEPNKIAFMMNEAEGELYVKTTDSIGKQSDVHIFQDVTPKKEAPAPDLSGYVTRQDFNDFTSRFGELEDKIARLFESLTPKKKLKKEETDDAE